MTEVVIPASTLPHKEFVTAMKTVTTKHGLGGRQCHSVCQWGRGPGGEGGKRKFRIFLPSGVATIIILSILLLSGVICLVH